jgi:hypothetical protein
VDLPDIWHRDSSGNDILNRLLCLAKNGHGFERYLGASFRNLPNMGISAISCRNFAKKKPAIEFYDLEYIYLPL